MSTDDTTDRHDVSLAEKKARGPINFARQPRRPVAPQEPAFAAPVPVPATPKRSVQYLKAAQRKSLVHVVNREARFPPEGSWPIEMRADMVAAFLDFGTTRELCKAIGRGEAPAPNAARGAGKDIELVWYCRAVEDFVARRNLSANAPSRPRR
jgi:hypothetical protein